MIFNNYKLVDDFLEAIFPLPKRFGIIVGQRHYTSDDDEDTDMDGDLFCLKTEIWGVDQSASVMYGVSKIVITSPNLNGVVIKIPFNGYFILDEITRENYIWYPFKYASGTDCNDYCLTEFEKYQHLTMAKLNCFAAETEFYKEIDGVRIFLQEEVIPENDSCTIHNPSKRSKDLADKWYDEDKFKIEPEWIANCLDKYGESKVENFLYYCTNIDEDILQDTHGGNYGYRKDGTPCLLDFSGYND